MLKTSRFQWLISCILSEYTKVLHIPRKHINWCNGCASWWAGHEIAPVFGIESIRLIERGCGIAVERQLPERKHTLLLLHHHLTVEIHNNYIPQ